MQALKITPIPVRPLPASLSGALFVLMFALACFGLTLRVAQAQQSDMLPIFGIRLTGTSNARPQVGKPLPNFGSVSALERYVADVKAKMKARREAREKALGLKKGGRAVQRVASAEEIRLLKEEDKATDYLDALLFYLRQRATPHDRVDWSAWPRAIEHRDRMPAGRVRPARSRKGEGGVHQQAVSPESVWEYVGPRNVSTPYQFALGPGPVSGRVNALSYTPLFLDPGLNTPGTYYAAGAGGGLWKTTDYGENWTPLSNDWPGQRVSCITVDPTDSNTIYVGSGDVHGFVGYSFGIMKSTDGGATWRQLGKDDFGDFPVSDILVDPEYPNIVVAATADTQDPDGAHGGLWRSTDGGETWEELSVPSKGYTGLAMGQAYIGGDFGTRRIYYAIGCGNLSTGLGGVWGSSDRGATWTPLADSGAEIMFYGADITTSVFTPDYYSPRSDVIYIVSGWDSLILYGVVPIVGDEPDFANVTWGDISDDYPGDFSQWFYNYYIAATEGLSFFDTVYAGQIGLGLAPFALLGGWLDISLSYTGADLTHVDQHSIAISPFDPNESLIGNDGGVYRLLYDPFFQTWEITSLNQTMGTIEFYRAAFHPFDPNRMIGGTQDNSTLVAAGDMNNWRIGASGDGGFCAINPRMPAIQYATSQFLRIYRTNNEWRSWFRLGGPPSLSDQVYFTAPITLDPANPNFLYAGTNYLYRYNAQTGRWSQRLGNVKLSNTDAISYIAVAPGDSNRIYTGSGVGEVFMSRNRGQTWQRIDSGIESLPTLFTSGIAVHPADPNRVIVAFSGTGSGHVWRCDNTLAGPNRTWTDISGSGPTALPDIPVNSITLDPVDPTNTYYVGTDIGVFMTTDGGQNWSNITQPLGLPNVQVNDVHAVAGTGYLMAATYGRGMWRLKIAEEGVPPISLTITPPLVPGGRDATATVVLASPAPAFGQVVTVTSSDPDVVEVPATVTVPAGYRTKNFIIKTKPVTSFKQVTVSVTSAGITKSAIIRVFPAL